ncbi:hypothetical protein ABT187_49595 [Streptomyces sp. NPDC001817]|uniref:hypothetical protein n=1 Tax=Streptomyces sp. NPDC001817 TaxID=3154398 RepID=UPI00332EA68F
MPASAARHDDGSEKVLDLTTTLAQMFGNSRGPVGSVFGGSGTTTKTGTKEPFGTLGFVCTIVAKTSAGSTQLCNTGFDTPHGQITLEGISPLPSPFQQAITGGTGKFVTARGYAQFTVVPGTSAHSVLHLLRT